MLTIYKASAGSGKTYTLVLKYIQFLLEKGWNNSHRRILAVTFTHKATSEMKTRIVKELHALGQNKESSYRESLSQTIGISPEELNKRAHTALLEILQDYSRFSISTIDSFFQQVVRAFVREIGLSGSYSIELEYKELLNQAIDNLFFDLDSEENATLFRWLTEFTEDNIENSRDWNPRREISKLGEELFKEDYLAKLSEAHESLHDKQFLNAYKSQLTAIVKHFEQKLIDLGTQGNTIINTCGLERGDFAKNAINYFDKLEKGTIEIPTEKAKTFAKCGDNSEALHLKNAPAHVKATIANLYNAELGSIIHTVLKAFGDEYRHYNSARIILKTLNTIGILADVSEYIKRLETEENVIPISNTNIFLKKIIDGSEAPFIYEKTGTRIDHYMIDEFQDTSTMQWDNFRPLVLNSVSEQNDNLVVGDVKQSIYRWRSSDWNLLDSKVPQDKLLEPQICDLVTNWRSCERIIQFNNALFRAATQLLALQIPHGAEKIEHAYESLEQKCAKHDGRGYVEIDFIDNSEKDWREQATAAIIPTITHLQERGFPLHNIAILARKTNDVQQITEHLISNNIRVVSNEGMLVVNAASVRFILGLMHLFVHTDDAVRRTNVNYLYARYTLKKNQNEAVSVGVQSDTLIFNEQELETLEHIRHLSIFDMVGKIIDLFNLRLWEQEFVFVQAFQDATFNFSTNKRSDLPTFFEWWDKRGVKLTVPMPEVEHAVQVMTIHKSKGLEFKAVLIPYCEWDLDLSANLRHTMWCKPNVAPFDQLPLVAVSYGTGLDHSIFSEEYHTEQLNQHIDNLNLLYVAFTRPEIEMYCWAPRPTSKLEKIKSVGELIYTCLDKKDLIQLGEQTAVSIEKKKANSEKITFFALKTRDKNHPQLQLAHTRKRAMDSTQQSLGDTMHEILCGIKQRDDQEKAIYAVHSAGRIDLEQVERIRQEFDKFWEIKGVEEWFAADNTILNEVSILTPEGRTYRPDRVIIRPDHTAVVVDYKFGLVEHTKHLTQVSNYRELIEQMGYTTKAYICYAELGKIIEVKA